MAVGLWYRFFLEKIIRVCALPDFGSAARTRLANSRFFHSFSFFLSIGIALVIPLFQSQNINSLYDISYLITNWYRIAEGQIPYRDFILVHNPGSFIIGGLLFKAFGNSYYVVLSWTCFVNLFALLSLRRILIKLKLSEIERSTLTILLSFVLPYSISALPNYDADSTFAVLLCLLLFIHLILAKSTSWLAWFSFGVLSVLPFTIKQNIGLAFVFSMVLVLCIGGYFRELLQFIGGIATTLVILAFAMSLLEILGDWWNYSIVFAAKSRLDNPLIHLKGLPGHPQFMALVLSILSTLFLYLKFSKSLVQQRLLIPVFILFTFPALLILGENAIGYIRVFRGIASVAQFVSTSESLFGSSIFLLFWIPWFLGLVTSWSVVKGLINAKLSRDEFISLSLNLVLIFCLYSALLSQGINGSTYSNGSFLVLLVICSLKLISSSRLRKFGKEELRNARLTRSLITVAKLNYSIFLLILTFVYFVTGLSGGRLAFVDSTGKKESNTQIGWLQTPGDYLPNQKYAEEILQKYSDKETVVVFIPSSGFGHLLADTPPLADVHTFDTTTNPYFDDLEKFLNCNLVSVAVYDTRMQVSVESYSLESFTTHAKYGLIETNGPYYVFTLRKGINLEPENYICPSTSYSKRLINSNSYDLEGKSDD